VGFFLAKEVLDQRLIGNITPFSELARLPHLPLAQVQRNGLARGLQIAEYPCSGAFTITLAWAISAAIGWVIAREIQFNLDREIGWPVGRAISGAVGGFVTIWQIRKK
jgi:hypothetical protein